MKKNSLLVFSIISIISICLISFSFAYWYITKSQSDDNIMITSCLKMSFVDGNNSINLTNAFPMSDEEGSSLEPYTFTIKNNCNNDEYYQINLEMLEDNTLSSKYLKIILNNEINNLGELKIGSKKDDSSKESRILTNGKILAKEQLSFNIIAYLDGEKANDQNSMNKLFSSKVIIEGSLNEYPKTQKCIRANNLHTEICNNNSGTYYCSASKYSNGATITYGNLGTKGTLNSGDAFTCDVNGDGEYDEETERFYYLTDMDENTSVLIYYTNTYNGVPTNINNVSYSSNGSNRIGPVDVISYLPTSTQWSNISLKNAIRDIYDNNNNLVISGFSYEGYAARLITFNEMQIACGITLGNNNRGELDNCDYLMENTKYSDSSLTYGYWLENPLSTKSGYSWKLSGYLRTINDDGVKYSNYYGTRPVIEIDKSQLEV